jgi:hypothetical protein
MIPKISSPSGGNAWFETLTMKVRLISSTCGGEQENNKEGRERKGKPCIKSDKSVIFHLVIE